MVQHINFSKDCIHYKKTLHSSTDFWPAFSNSYSIFISLITKLTLDFRNPYTKKHPLGLAMV